jgi:hypothetical protein
MRMSDWRARAPFKGSVAPKVMAVVESAFEVLGAERDPECWVVWGDDPSVRYLIYALTPAGLAQVNVRVLVHGEGPRAGGKVLRWNRVQLGELGVEIQGGHRLVTFQIEAQVLNGVDASADAIGTFARALFASVDGRTASFSVSKAARSGSRSPTKSRAAKSSAAKSAMRTPSAGRSATRATDPGRAGTRTSGSATSSTGTPDAATAVRRIDASKGSTS